MAYPVSEELLLPGGGFSVVLLGRISHPSRVYVAGGYLCVSGVEENIPHSRRRLGLAGFCHC